jgi:hypothetical protein
MVFHGYNVINRQVIQFFLECPSDTNCAFIRYTTDGWKTQRNICAESYRYWVIPMSIGEVETSEKFEFAFCVKTSSGEIWDNNDGKNYILYGNGVLGLPEKFLGYFDDSDEDEDFERNCYVWSGAGEHDGEHD